MAPRLRANETSIHAGGGGCPHHYGEAVAADAVITQHDAIHPVISVTTRARVSQSLAKSAESVTQQRPRKTTTALTG